VLFTSHELEEVPFPENLFVTKQHILDHVNVHEHEVLAEF